jgi:hypothetical protein
MNEEWGQMTFSEAIDAIRGLHKLHKEKKFSIHRTDEKWDKMSFPEALDAMQALHEGFKEKKFILYRPGFQEGSYLYLDEVGGNLTLIMRNGAGGLYEWSPNARDMFSNDWILDASS